MPNRSYDIDLEGRFLMTTEEATAAPQQLNVLLGWTAAPHRAPQPR
jgi:hypothetical protein